MGWKLAAIVSRLEGSTLQSFVDGIYGKPQTLKGSALTFLDVMYPRNERDRFALEHEGFGWVFDAPLASRALERPLPVAAATSVFLLHSVTGLYGFSTQANGSILRARSGCSDDGVIRDIGSPSNAEIALVTAGVEDGQAAWNAWSTAAETFNDGEDVLDTIGGEEVVFGLIDTLTGIRIDSPAPEATALHSAIVMTIAPEAGLFTRIFGKR